MSARNAFDYVLLPLAALLAAILFASFPALAATASWSEPALDRWFHQEDPAPGLKDLMSTFSNYEPGAGFYQSRPGSFMLGFDTSDQIPLEPAHRYQINSIRFTLDYVDDSRNVAYDPTIDDLAAILGGTDDPGKPIELFGVGYDNGYTRLGFGANDSNPPEFEESSPLWPTGLPSLEKTFNVYPLGDDGTGQLGNVFNSPGGEGRFEFDPVEEEYVLVETVRDPWNTTPWAVGVVDGLSPGATIPALSVFEFEVNLALPGVVEYFQQNLAMGQMAVFITSLHDLTGFHEGGNAAYPAFHAKDSLWVEFGLASAPTLEIDYAILPETVPGDFDGDGDVDADDLSDWQVGYGMDGQGDADSDGDTDGRDFLIWQRNYTGPTSLMYSLGSYSASTAVSPIPEPTSLTVVIFGIITCLSFRTTRRMDS